MFRRNGPLFTENLHVILQNECFLSEQRCGGRALSGWIHTNNCACFTFLMKNFHCQTDCSRKITM